MPHQPQWKFNPANLLSVACLLTTIAFLLVFFSEKETAEYAEPDDVRSFAICESAYNNGNLMRAAELYQGFLRNFPDRPLAALARRRVSEITRQQEIDEAERIRINLLVDALIRKADAAFKAERFFQPETDCVVFYTNQILALRHDHIRAMDLQDRTVEIFERKGQSALRKADYGDAERYFRNVLQIYPDDDFAVNKLHYISIITARRDSLSASLD